MMTFFSKSHIHNMSSFFKNSNTTFLFTFIVFLSPCISSVNAALLINGSCNTEGSNCWIFLFFGIAFAIIILAGVCIKIRERENKTSTTDASTVVTRRIASYRTTNLNRNTVQVDRRNENNVATRSDHHVVDIDSSNGEVNQPPPPYFKDSTLPRYT